MKFEIGDYVIVNSTSKFESVKGKIGTIIEIHISHVQVSIWEGDEEIVWFFRKEEVLPLTDEGILYGV